MNANFLSIVKRIVLEQGESILVNPQQLKGLISDYAKDEPRAECLAFGRCIEYGAYTELKNAPDPDRAAVKNRLAQRLHSGEGLEMTLCTGALDLLEAAVWGSSSPAALPAAYPQASAVKAAYTAPAAPQYPQGAVQPAQAAHAAPAAPQSSYHTYQPGQVQTNAMLRRAAREQLRGSWLPAAGMVFVWLFILILLGLIGGIGYIVFYGPLMLGVCGYFLTKARGGAVTMGAMFGGFNMFGPGFLLYFLMSFFLVLWTCLLIIPGIVKSLSYSMAYYILLDNPRMSALDAITASRRMMEGYKGKLLCLYLSFTGWALLCILSLGIGFFWLIPYAQLTMANFYEDLNKNNIS
ncbi:MAG: DUF975 family protein [Spirochaetaceae bacterium]|jgi:uncharacterized membrane protein|nr:DUF975 family protein [Spirochaetaceae bacterium]